MKRFVVDASVAVKWLVPENHNAEAERLLEKEHQLRAPDLLWAECGNILWKKWRRQELAADEVKGLLQDLKRFPLQIVPSEPLCETAWEIAHQFDRSFYDSLYLALSFHGAGPLVTADRRLYNVLQGMSPEIDLVWIEDLA